MCISILPRSRRRCRTYRAERRRNSSVCRISVSPGCKSKRFPAAVTFRIIQTAQCCPDFHSRCDRASRARVPTVGTEFKPASAPAPRPGESLHSGCRFTQPAFFRHSNGRVGGSPLRPAGGQSFPSRKAFCRSASVVVCITSRSASRGVQPTTYDCECDGFASVSPGALCAGSACCCRA